MSRTVLLVDDEEEILTLLTIELLSEGYQVIKAHTGAQAVRAARDLKPDLIVLDILMPDIDGGQVSKILRSDPLTKHIPIIFLTAVLTKEEESVDHLSVTINEERFPAFAKPFNIQELLGEIKKTLHRNVRTIKG